MKKSEIRAKILESLMDIDDTVDYEHETALVTDRILDPLPSFRSSAIWKMPSVSRLQHRRWFRKTSILWME